MGRAALRVLHLTVLACALTATVRAEEPAPLFRVFLTDGRSLTSFGEWARLDDRVAFSLPLSEGEAPDLQLVTLPDNRVDWPRTERYAATVRAVHYASTRAEEDYAAFSNQVADVLTGVAREPDPKRRLMMAQGARAALADWPKQHHGYRSEDVQQMLTLLDEVVSDLRASAGQDSFEFGLVAATPPPLAEALMSAPTTRQLAEELVAASTLAETSGERITLLERLVTLIDRAASLLPTSWAVAVRQTALNSIATDRAVDASYAKLAGAVFTEATALSKKADVRGLERLRARVMKTDASLGAKRPAEITAVLAAVEAASDTARRQRLALDQRQLLEPAYRSYERSVYPVLRELARVSPSLQDIRAQAGPSPEILNQAMARFYKARPAVAGTIPPPTLAAAHALLQSAWDLADSALRIRLIAVESGDGRRAGEASAAAAGALLMIERATQDLDAVLKAPAVP